MSHRQNFFYQYTRASGIWVVAILIWVSLPCQVFSQGALSGERYRILISSDIGGSDEDDDQSLVHYLMYADLFDLEGLVSSPPHAGRAKDFKEVIDIYKKDYPKLKKYSKKYPSPSRLNSLVKQGATDPAPEQGFSQSTEGSEWIIKRARKKDPRPLYILVWGAITDVAQALHDAPDIKDKIRVHFIASWNEKIGDPSAFQYIDKNHPDLWMIRDNSTFRGWYVGGKQNDDLGNETFIERHIRHHGALGDYFYPLKKKSIKMGDSPTVARLLKGNPGNPEEESWGGQFMKVKGRPNWWTDIEDPAKAEGKYPGAKTVNKWREEYLRDWQSRMEKLK